MRVAAAVAEALRRGGGRVSDRVSRESADRGGGGGRYPDDHRTAGADGDPHGGCGVAESPAVTGSVCSRCSTARERRTRSEELRRRGVTRFRSLSSPADTGGPASGCSLGFNAFLNFQHVTKCCEQVWSLRRCRPRCGGRSRRRATGARARLWSRSRPTCSQEELPARAATTAGATRFAAAPTRRRSRGRAGARGGRSGRCSTPARASTTRGPGPQLRDAGRAARGPGDDEPAGQERLPGEPPARARLGRAGDPEARASTSSTSADVIFGDRLQLLATLRRADARRARRSSMRRSTPRDINKDVPADHALRRRRGADARRAARGGRERLGGKPRGRPSAVAERDRAASESEWLAAVDAEADLGRRRRSRPYRVIWDLHAHRRRRATRSSPTTPAARATSSRRSGSARRRCPTSAGARRPSSATGSAWRWAPSSPRPTSSASTSGATPRSASPAWTSRPPSASGSRSCRSCSTTSRWRSSCRSCRSRPRSTARPTSAATTPTSPGARRLRRARHRAGEIVPAIQRGIEQTQEGTPALLEFITAKEIEYSMLG